MRTYYSQKKVIKYKYINLNLHLTTLAKTSCSKSEFKASFLLGLPQPISESYATSRIFIVT